MKSFENCVWYQTIRDKEVFSAYRGSMSHGMYVPKNDPNCIDDIDVMCIVLMPKEYYLGIPYGKDAWEIKQDEWDVVVYELKKFFNLLMKSNPNVLYSLWLDEEFMKGGEYYNIIKKNRELFLSKEVYSSFIGYAHGQAERMNRFQKYEGYMGAKRKELVDKFGYDCKNASHALRILKMGVECLLEGKFNVTRTHDREHLLDIKKGKLGLTEVTQEIEHWFNEAKKAVESSTLPEKQDWNKVNGVLIEIMSLYLNKEMRP